MILNAVNSYPQKLAEAILLTKRFAEGTPAGRGRAGGRLNNSNELEGNKKHHSNVLATV